MGHRTLKRVPLDFQWPLNKVWEGYINPHQGPINCKDCAGTGYNPATRQLSDDFYDHDGQGVRWQYDYGIAPDGTPATRPPWLVIGECRAWNDKITQDEVLALVKAGRLWDFTRKPINDEQREVVRKKLADGGNSWLPYDNGYIPTAEEVNAVQHRGMSCHDCINRWVLIEARAKRLGVWGKCSSCRGKGEIQPPRKKKKAYKKWREYEPPTGDGYQLWENVSEGSPITPVFETIELLAVWCSIAENFGDRRPIPESKWLEVFREEGGVEAGSMIIGHGSFVGAAINLPQNS